MSGMTSSLRSVSLAMLIAWCAVSTSAVVIVIAQPIHPLVIAAGRLSLSTLFWAFLARGELSRVREALRERSVARSVVLGGLVLAAHFAAWIWSLELTSVAHGAVLVATQPIFAGLCARFVGDRVSPWLFVGVAIAIGGTLLMTTGEPISPGPNPLLGDALAVFAAFAAAVYLLVGRAVSERVSLATYMFALNGVASAALWLAVIGLGIEIASEETTVQDWLAVVWLGFAPGFIGHGLLNWSSRRVPVHFVSLVGLLEPVGATALAWIVLDAQITGREALGEAILLLGAGLALGRAARGSRK